MERISRSLEDQFFFNEDLKLLEKQRILNEMKETKEALKEVSGIQDENVLQSLVKLNIRPETVASLALVPLIEVAWANGSIGPKEKNAVLSAANKFGWSNKSIDYELLECWLEHKPGPSLLKAWAYYTGYVCARMNPDEIERLNAEIISHAKEVAEAGGGVLGMGKISAREKEILGIIQEAFAIGKGGKYV
jgi:hypothetical protein